MKRQSGFTVIELIVVIVLFVLAGMFFLQQKTQIERVDRDRERKTALNAFHYSLEEVYFKANNHYPRSIDSKVLPSVDPKLFEDPDGRTVGSQDSDYTYEPLSCESNTCKAYTLRAKLESESDYVIKSSR